MPHNCDERIVLRPRYELANNALTFEGGTTAQFSIVS